MSSHLRLVIGESQNLPKILQLPLLPIIFLTILTPLHHFLPPKILIYQTQKKNQNARQNLRKYAKDLTNTLLGKQK